MTRRPFTPPAELNGTQLVDELAAAGVTLRKDPSSPLPAGPAMERDANDNDVLVLDVDDHDYETAQRVVAAHVARWEGA